MIRSLREARSVQMLLFGWNAVISLMSEMGGKRTLATA
jgi:hypothetical protein